MAIRSLVVVPVDGSREMERTVEFAVGIAKQRAADVHALQIVPRAGALWSAPEDETSVRARLRVLRASADGEGVLLRIVTLRGTPERAIPAYAQLNAAGVIVIGQNYGSSRFWRNSTIASRVSRTSPVPAIVLPAHDRAARRLSWTRIVAAVDFTVASAMALRTALDLSKRHGARVTIVHAMDPSRGMVTGGGEAWQLLRRLPAEATAIADRLRNAAMAFGLGLAEPVVVTGSPDRGILDTAAERDADLIVMGAAPRHWLDLMLFGSTLRAVLRQAMTPVLVLPVVGGAHDWIDAIHWREEGAPRALDGPWRRGGAAVTAVPGRGYMLT